MFLACFNDYKYNFFNNFIKNTCKSLESHKKYYYYLKVNNNDKKIKDKY